jgi:hypothetical protein
MLNFINFAHRIRQFDDLWVSVSPRQYEMHSSRFLPDDLQHLLQVHQAQGKSIIDFVQDENIELPRFQLLAG